MIGFFFELHFSQYLYPHDNCVGETVTHRTISITIDIADADPQPIHDWTLDPICRYKSQQFQPSRIDRQAQQAGGVIVMQIRSAYLLL